MNASRAKADAGSKGNDSDSSPAGLNDRRLARLSLAAGILFGLFILVDLCFLGANISKIIHGAWFPLVVGAMAFTLILTWENGR